MLILAAGLLLVAALLQSWYSGNAMAAEPLRARGLSEFGIHVQLASLLLLVAGLWLVFWQRGLPATAGVAVSYLLVILVVLIPILRRLELIPGEEDRGDW